jgi:putative membrane protein
MFFLIVFLILALIVAVLAVAFAIQNPTVIPITFLIWGVEGPVTLVLLVAYLAGIITMLLILLPGIIRRGRKIATLNKKIKDLAKTLPEEEKKEKEKEKVKAEAETEEQEA